MARSGGTTSSKGKRDPAKTKAPGAAARPDKGSNASTRATKTSTAVRTGKAQAASTRPNKAQAASAQPKKVSTGSPPTKAATSRPAEAAFARILAAIRAIPAGSVAGYGVVARRAGLPGRARLVARILSGNADAGLPWHRVLRSDGRIAFPPDSAGHAEQTQRLRTEGVAVENGRVRDIARSERALDALLWAPRRR